MTISFDVPIRAIPMSRPRVTSHGTYYPRRCKEYRDVVSLAAKAAMRGESPTKDTCCCSVCLSFAVPKSYTKAKKQAALLGDIYPDGRNTGDLDNHAKAILDALNGVVFEDDSQVVSLSMMKMYDTSDNVRISVTTV